MNRSPVRATAIALGLAFLSGCATSKAPEPRHLIYLHGRIVQEEQSARPRHPDWGDYEFDAILDAFRQRGFVVHGEIRPKTATVSESADRVVAEVRELLASGVPPDHVTVVGASMGASIAFTASARLANPELRFCTLGACLSANVRAMIEEDGRAPCGRWLAVREASDEVSEPCDAWTGDAKAPRLDGREIVIRTGLSHGFLYRPLPEWVEPVVDHARGTEHASSGAGARADPSVPTSR